MRSCSVLSEEIDDIVTASDELVSAVWDKLGELDRASVGIIYCDAETDAEELTKVLEVRLGIPVVGLTTSAVIERDAGYCDMGIAMTVLTGDDVDISIGSTAPLDKDGYEREIERAYEHARAGLAEDPKLIIVLAPFIQEITSDRYMEKLSNISGGVPIFGGVASDCYDLKYHRTFFNGEASDRALRFVMISGAIEPVFAMKHHFSGGVDRSGRITQSSGDRVEKVNGKTFRSFISEMMEIPDDEAVVYQFQSIPFTMEMPDYVEGEEPVIRDLFKVDSESEAGIFLADMPQGSKLSMSVIHRDDIRKSSEATFDLLLERMKASGREFSTVLITTCNGRHVLMGDDKQVESRVMSTKLDSMSGISTIGFYAFGEFCPTMTSSGEMKNRFHNQSFALCAF